MEGVQRIIDDVAAWSFKQCLRNEYPQTDHDGIPLRNSRGRLALQPLHPGGAIPVFTGTVGDWKWHVETFNLQHHYGRDETCELCLATKTAGDLNLGNALPDAGWTFTARLNTDFINQHEVNGTLHGFCTIPGWHIGNIFEDVLFSAGRMVGTFQRCWVAFLGKLHFWDSCISGNAFWEPGLIVCFRPDSTSLEHGSALFLVGFAS